MVRAQLDADGSVRMRATRSGWFAVACLMVTVLSPMAWDIVKTEVHRPVEMQRIQDQIQANTLAIKQLIDTVNIGVKQDNDRDVVTRQQLEIDTRKLDSDEKTLDDHGHRIDWLENRSRETMPQPRQGDRRPGIPWPR